MDYKLFWTEEAIRNLEEILDYLVDNWKQKEVEGFKEKLSKLDLILINPKMFPVSSFNSRLKYYISGLFICEPERYLWY